MRAARAFAVSMAIHAGLLGLAWVAVRGRARLEITASESVSVVEDLRPGNVEEGAGKPASDSSADHLESLPTPRRPETAAVVKGSAMGEPGSDRGKADAPVPSSDTGASGKTNARVGEAGSAGAGVALAIKPRYPRASRALGEEGSVVVHARLLPDGALTEIRLVRTSGFARLDAAALEAASAAHATFTNLSPNPPGATPSASAVERDFTIVFRLTDPN